jgi:hypothetical protein
MTRHNSSIDSWSQSRSRVGLRRSLSSASLGKYIVESPSNSKFKVQSSPLRDAVAAALTPLKSNQARG